MNIEQLQQRLNHCQPRDQQQWNPPFCGDIDIHIKLDGSWWYMDTPISRQSLVKLFASILRKENDEYFLVTPVEKVKIKVDDSPFVITQWHYEDTQLIFTTNLDETLIVGEHHPVLLQLFQQNPIPYVSVKQNLWARLHQNVYYALVNHAQIVTHDNTSFAQLTSGSYTFNLGSFRC